jgi:hypothetical protein
VLGLISRAVNEGNKPNVNTVDEAGFDGLGQLRTEWSIVVEYVDDDDR